MKTFVISECGINHQGNLQDAKDLIEASKECGCSAVKFQTYTTEKRVAPNSPIFDILKKCELSYEQQTELKQYADQIGIEFFSTPFDTDALDFLVEDLKVERIKVASFDVTNKEFMGSIGQYLKDRRIKNVIVSTGMANRHEIEECICSIADEYDYLTKYKISLLHCVSAYPVEEEKVNLGAIKKLSFYPGSVGYSDHTSGIEVPALSVVAGAQIVEKHFTLDLNNGAPDNPVSADPKMMRSMIEKIQSYETIMGDGKIKMEEVEEGTQQFRRFS